MSTSACPSIDERDLRLLSQGAHPAPYEVLGAHVVGAPGVSTGSGSVGAATAGTRFAVWAPNARSVSVVGDFNHWDGRVNPMQPRGHSGIWETFVEGVGPGAL